MDVDRLTERGPTSVPSLVQSAPAAAAFVILVSQLAGFVAKVRAETEMSRPTRQRRSLSLSSTQESVNDEHRHKLRTGHSEGQLPPPHMLGKTNHGITGALDEMDAKAKKMLNEGLGKTRVAASLFDKSVFEMVTPLFRAAPTGLEHRMKDDSNATFSSYSSSSSAEVYGDLSSTRQGDGGVFTSARTRRDGQLAASDGPLFGSIEGVEFLHFIFNSNLFELSLNVLLELRNVARIEHQRGRSSLMPLYGSCALDKPGLANMAPSWLSREWSEATAARAEARIRLLTKEKEAKIADLKAQAKFRHNLRLQLAGRTQVFEAVDELANAALRPAIAAGPRRSDDWIPLPPGGDNRSFRPRHLFVPAPRVPAVLIQVLKGDTNYGPTLRTAVESVVMLKSSERVLVIQNLKLKLCVKRLLQMQGRKHSYQKRLETWHPRVYSPVPKASRVPSRAPHIRWSTSTGFHRPLPPDRDTVSSDMDDQSSLSSTLLLPQKRVSAPTPLRWVARPAAGTAATFSSAPDNCMCNLPMSFASILQAAPPASLAPACQQTSRYPYVSRELCSGGGLREEPSYSMQWDQVQPRGSYYKPLHDRVRHDTAAWVGPRRQPPPPGAAALRKSRSLVIASNEHTDSPVTEQDSSGQQNEPFATDGSGESSSLRDPQSSTLRSEGTMVASKPIRKTKSKSAFAWQSLVKSFWPIGGGSGRSSKRKVLQAEEPVLDALHEPYSLYTSRRDRLAGHPSQTHSHASDNAFSLARREAPTRSRRHQ